MRQNLTYLYNVASQFIGKLGIYDIDPGDTPLPQWLFDTYGERVYELLRRWSPERLGGLVVYGEADDQAHRTSLYQVHCSTWLSRHASGEELLRRIAATTVIAAIADVIDRRR